jgi:hypothetical protein
MASISTGKNGRRRIVYKDAGKVRRCIRLGFMPLRGVKEIKTKVETIVVAVELVPARTEQAVLTLEHFAKATRQSTQAGAVSSIPEQSGETVEPGKGRENANSSVLATTASSPGRTRTYDKPVNSRLLYQLSYRGV